MTRALINEIRNVMENKNKKYSFSAKETNYFSGNMLKRGMQALKKDPKLHYNLGSLDFFEISGGDENPSFDITASFPSEAVRKLEKALVDFRNKDCKRDRNAYHYFVGLELDLVDGNRPTSQDKNIFKGVINKYTQNAMFNTPTGRGPSDLEQFVKKEALDEPLESGVL